MGVHYVTLRGETAKTQDLKSTDDRLLQIEVHSPIPEQAGWRIEMQHVRGLGAYRVVQRPAADNGWRLEVRVQDDNRAWAAEVSSWCCGPYVNPDPGLHWPSHRFLTSKRAPLHSSTGYPQIDTSEPKGQGI